MIIGKEPIHSKRIRPETHKTFEVTSRRRRHVHLKMLKLSQYLRKLHPLSLDTVTPSSFFVLKAHTVCSGERLHLGCVNTLSYAKEEDVP